MLRRAALSVVVVAWGMSSAAVAQQSVTLDQFRPGETPGDAFVLSNPSTPGHLRVGAKFSFSYANDPLVYEAVLGDSSSETFSIVRTQFRATAGFSVGILDWLAVFVGLPLDLYMGDDVDAGPLPLQRASGGGFGDFYLGLRAHLLGGGDDDLLSLGIQASLTAPTGRSGSYRGDNFLSFHPELLAAIDASVLTVTANLGLRIREDEVFGTAEADNRVRVGDQATYALGVALPVLGEGSLGGSNDAGVGFTVHAQVWGATSLASFFDREESPTELLGGVTLEHRSGFIGSLSASTGISRGLGSPDARVTLSLAYQTRIRTTPPRRPRPRFVDRDGDGLVDQRDGCPTEAEDDDGFQDEDGCPDNDNDNDRVPDSVDECPLDAEDRDGYEDRDGCPDPDNDGDGLSDLDDRCPNQAEDVDGFEDQNGCPEPDNDMDEIPDVRDRCPNLAGLAAAWGCPDTDRDEDGIVDRLDNCPDEVGSAANQGCRVRQRVVIRETRLEILDKVYFDTNSATIQSRSHRLLDNVAQVVRNHPEIPMVRIEGHTDDQGDDGYNLGLSQRRAEAVVAYLVSGGVDAARLLARGFGETRPIGPNDTAAARGANRRVEFNLGAATEEAPVVPEASTAMPDDPESSEAALPLEPMPDPESPDAALPR